MRREALNIKARGDVEATTLTVTSANIVKKNLNIGGMPSWPGRRHQHRQREFRRGSLYELSGDRLQGRTRIRYRSLH